MKTCPNCSKQNDVTKMFCGGCGEDISDVQPTGSATTAPAVTTTPNSTPAAAPDPTVTTPTPAPTPLSTADAICMLTWENGDSDNPETRTVPLATGGTITIGREGTGTPDLAIPSTGVPRKFIEVSDLGDGTLSVKDTGSSLGFMIAKKVKPGESGKIVLADGEYIICGDAFIFVQ